MNHQCRPIPLYPNPSLFSPQTRVESASSDDSDFPPIRECNGAPDLLAWSTRNHYHPHRSPQTWVKSASSGDSEPLPIQEHKNTPNLPASSTSNPSHPRHSLVVQKQPERQLSPSEEPGPSRLWHRRPSSGLGGRNCINTIEAGTLVQHAKNIIKPSLKRDAEVLKVADDRLFKKQCVTFTNDDTDWLKREISDVKECMKEIADHLRGDTDYRLEELLRYVRESAELQ